MNGIVAQPFLLKIVEAGKLARHVPDFFLVADGGPLVVDVKPRRRLCDPVVEFTFAWTRREVEARGWRYEGWSEPPEEVLGNIRFLAGYRRSWLFAAEVLGEVRQVDLGGRPILSEAVGKVSALPEPTARAAIHHLLWTQELGVDLSEPLRPSTVLRRAG